MKDFTLIAFEKLLKTLQKEGYHFVTFENFLTTKPQGKQVILRHDVDKRPKNSLRTAQIEHALGIKGVYYFRIVKESNVPKIIKAIANLGHEIGYHYEDMALVNGNIEKALQSFEKNLMYFRTFYPVKTICMHGSPMSKWDNKEIWKKYNYKDYGLIGEPYFDIDFNKFLYLTDTGRTWNGEKVSVRDKVTCGYHFEFETTEDIINAVHKLPDQIMITTHPQRWTNNNTEWMVEYVLQNSKNFIKRIIAS
ncbi:MAG: hypothetical protein ABI315_04800 [Bacteroidia bacterium]